MGEGLRFAFRHFPLTEIHPHALPAAAAAEAAALQGRFWDMHELLFHRQTELEDDDLRRYALELEQLLGAAALRALTDQLSRGSTQSSLYIGIVLMLVVYFAPDGLVGVWRRARGRVS